MTPYLPKCSCPLIFESEYEAYPYGVAGSGFLAKTFGRYYFITARHCLREGDHNALRVPVVLGKPDLIELRDFGSTTLTDSEDDTDHADFAIFSIAPSFEPSQDFNALEAAHIPVSNTRCLLNPKVRLTVRGFPHDAPGTYIDYQKNHMSSQAVQCDASYVGAAESKFTHELDFVDSCPVKNINGMSGAPVFARIRIHGMSMHILVGIMLRAKRFCLSKF